MRLATEAGLAARLDALPFSRWHRALFIVASLGILFDAADFAMFGIALPLIAREFHFGPQQSGLLASAGLAGAFLGALGWGTLSDRIGRRAAFQATIAMFAVFTGLMAVSWSLVSLLVFRVIANLGLGGTVPVAVTIVAEFSPPKVRGRATAGAGVGFPLGIVMAALLALTTLPYLGWRGFFAIGMLPALLVLAARRHMPESVRFLASRGRLAEAEATVARIEVAAGRTPATAGPVVAETHGRADLGANVAALLAPGRRRVTTLLWVMSFCFLWANNGLLFMLPTILTQRGHSLSEAIGFTLVLASFASVGYAFCAWAVDRWGRRPVLFLYFFVGALFHLAFALSTGAWMYATIALVGFVNPGVYGGASLYAGELYPTHLRASGVGWFFGIGRIGSFLAPAVIGAMLAGSLAPWTLWTFALAYLIAAFATLAIGVETRGRSIDATAI